MIFETHAHLLAEQYGKNHDRIIQSAFKNGISAILNVSDDMQSSRASIKLLERFSSVFGSVGIHPHNADEFEEEHLTELEQLSSHSKVLAIGEIGLDYHYDFCDREVQKEVFRKQLELAHELDLPVIIHDRKAHKDTLDILQSFGGSIKGVMHCYSGSAESVKVLIRLGLYISFTGVITFKNASKTIEALKAVPMDKLLIETDSPYMSPEPLRGRTNEPANLVYIAEKMAAVKQVSYSTLLDALWNNSFELFNKAQPYRQKLEGYEGY